MSRNRFGTILTEKRIAAGLSQANAAEALYVARSTYNHYETGTRIPPVEILIQMSILFKSDPMDLIIALMPDNILIEYPQYYKKDSHEFLSLREIQLITLFRSMNQDSKYALINLASLLTHSYYNPD